MQSQGDREELEGQGGTDGSGDRGTRRCLRGRGGAGATEDQGGGAQWSQMELETDSPAATPNTDEKLRMS